MPGVEGQFQTQIPVREANYDADGNVVKQFSYQWYNFFVFLASLFAKPVEGITVGASPHVFEATSIGSLHVAAGVVTSVVLQRGGVSLACPTSGFVPVAAGDTVTIEYTGIPDLSFIPAPRT